MSDPAGRYEALPTFTRALDDGRPVQLREPRLVPTPPTEGLLTVGAGARVDSIAARVLGDPYAWWRLADANLGVPVDELDDVGRRLHLPREGS